MRVTLISPRIAIQKGDFLGSGVPYWPLELAVFASFLRVRGVSVSVVDLFGSAPRRLEDRGDHYFQGLPMSAARHRPGLDAEVFVVYALSSMSHADVLEIVRELRRLKPAATLAVLENSQAVTAYSLPRLADELFAAGVDALLCGEPYGNWPAIQAFLSNPGGNGAPDNVLTPRSATRTVRRNRERLERYPVPAWELFELDAYWSLPYSHGPKTERYLPILTSRGCPYPCDFCVIPETNERRWRPRAPADVVAEMIELRDRFGVRDFQVEDVNPTVNWAQWDAIARLLIERDAKVRFYLVSGTKAETVRLSQVELLARAGCRYISISPESGSAAVLRAIGKPFDYGHGLELVAACRQQGIATQACFLVGHPSESAEDHRLSREYLKNLVAAGLDEVAVFIVAPLPGSTIHRERRVPLATNGALVSFSPRGRVDYGTAELRRKELIRTFFRSKLLRGPDLVVQGVRAIAGLPRTKMENLPRRIAYVYAMMLEHRLGKWFPTGRRRARA